MIKAADDVKQGLAIDPQLQEILQQGTNLGGARPKCTVTDEDGIWIAKFPEATDTFNNPRVEHACLTLAGACGLDVSASKLLTLPGGRDVLLVRRFDRIAADDSYSRIGFVSALSMLRSDEHDRHSWSYPGLAEQIRRQRVTRADLRELYRRMLFNVVVRNSDDHPRNHGFLYDAQRMRLAPAYDLVPQPARFGVAEDFQLAMTIGEHGRQATLTNVLSRCEAFGLDRDAAAEMCVAIGTAAAGWKAHFRATGVSASECRIFEGSFRLAEAFAQAR